MGTIVIWILAFLLAITVLVAVHEFGHYWVARRLGIKVLRFSIGFGKPLWRRIGGSDGTEYVISALPLGGYVKMLDERDCKVAPEERHRAFNNAPIAARLAVLAAGPLFNFLFAALIYWFVFMTGAESQLRAFIGDVEPDSYASVAGLRAGDEILSVGGKPVETWQDAMLAIIDDLVDDGQIRFVVRGASGGQRSANLDVGDDKKRLTEPGVLFGGLGISVRPPTPAVLSEIVPGEAAERAGLRPGDLVTSVDGEPIADWGGWVRYIQANPNRAVTLGIERDGRGLELPLTIGQTRDVEGKTIGRFGAGAVDPLEGRRIEIRYGPVKALGEAIARTTETSVFTVRMLGKMVTGSFSARNLSGPITIAEYAGTTAQMGPSVFISFLAFVSISLGIINLMPVPMLDGGQIVFTLVEAVKGRPLSPETELRGQQIGIVLLLAVMSLAIYNDIIRLLG